jgi:hypothetical protein
MSSTNTAPTLALLTSLDTTVSTLRTSLATLPSSPPASSASNPQESVRDALSVLEAQFTKLTLILTTPPLSPSAVREVITDLVARVLPALFSATAHIASDKPLWGRFYTSGLVDGVDAVFAAVGELNRGCKEVVAEGLEGGKDTLYVPAGKLFGLCGKASLFCTDGLAKCLLDRTKSAVALIKDAMEELKDWSEDLDEGTGPGSLVERLGDGLSRLDLDDLDDVRRLPAQRTDLRDLLGECLRRVELILKLYQASSKRRIKRFPDPRLSLRDADSAEREAHARNISVLDNMVQNMQDTSEGMDEMAHGFYQLDRSKAEGELAEITRLAREVAEWVRLDWEGQVDEFSEWVERWQGLIERKKGSSG